MKRKWIVVAGVIAGVLVGVGSSNVVGELSFTASGDDRGNGGGGAAAVPGGRALSNATGFTVAEDMAAQDASEPAASGYGGTAVRQRPAGLESVGPSVIKTAQLHIEIDRDGLRDSVQDAIATASAHGGFVVSTRVDGGEGARSGSIILRVPAERFERALDALHSLGTVEQELVSGQDVTEEFIDLEARLRHYEAQEAVLLNLMERAATVADTIRVQSELQGVQLEIERLRGRLRFLRDQTDLATIHVDLVEAGATAAPKNPFERAWENAADTFVAVLSGTIVAAGFVVPIGVLLAALYLVFRAVRPRLGSGSL